MVLCLLDCVLGGSIFALVTVVLVLYIILGGVPAFVCCAFDVFMNGSMNAVNLLMLALSRDRYLSVSDPLKNSLRSTTSTVWRHLKISLVYGAAHGAVFTTARAYYSDLTATLQTCDTFDWLLKPEFRAVAVVTVASNIFLDAVTMVYNGKVLYHAWKLKKTRVQELGQHNINEAAKRRQNMKMFIFTFKLACLFLGCSLPYKFALLAHGLGLAVPLIVLHLLGIVRSMFHIIDGWTFCANEELWQALKQCSLFVRNRR
ncbi:uncharacterized protein LOC119093905 [Pollicipes pollicipes]|uniref:uncharacterized protein LOC119092873 n=1 Tax=Pollicipes pollicipes TaxID=41117 RepID=UPI0018857B06|nr:uncharacterized protein LOC119092873 [Pollicipes pollicipes]XP_037072812.1 uncharacterized protein LOC119093905 [Pollicipes pollicipes]